MDFIYHIFDKTYTYLETCPEGTVPLLLQVQTEGNVPLNVKVNGVDLKSSIKSIVVQY
jgi:hypothetical protein